MVLFDAPLPLAPPAPAAIVRSCAVCNQPTFRATAARQTDALTTALVAAARLLISGDFEQVNYALGHKLVDRPCWADQEARARARAEDPEARWFRHVLFTVIDATGDWSEPEALLLGFPTIPCSEEFIDALTRELRRVVQPNQGQLIVWDADNEQFLADTLTL